MSEETDTSTSCCASCGIAENYDVTLKNCTACYLVKYCGVECQKAHRKQHKRECKKRATELRDELLFKQPECSHHGDCPICSLPLPIDPKKFLVNACCSKVICKGCCYANVMREDEMRLQRTCPFCREQQPNTNEECDKRHMKRVEVNDPFAICQWGALQYDKKDYRSSFEYFTKAAELGDAEAHFMLARLYHEGEGVEKDFDKEIYHLEEAAIRGHPDARVGLGVYERRHEKHDRAVKHWTIAATQGHDSAIKALIAAFKEGWIEKEDLASALRAHKAAADATKSPQRKEAEDFFLSVQNKQKPS